MFMSTGEVVGEDVQRHLGGHAVVGVFIQEVGCSTSGP